MSEYKKKETAAILSNEPLTDDIFRMQMSAECAGEALPGQFVNLYLNDGAHLLPRPISICGIDKEASVLTLVYRVAGFGTREFSKLGAGDEIAFLGPLGNGFPMQEAGKKALIIGGGVGIPPMLALAREWKGEADIVLGYRDAPFLLREFNETGFPVHAASDSGRVGRRGTVMDVIEAEGLTAEAAFACGPKPMLKAIREWAGKRGIPAYISMEERMACGVGVCLGCVCETTDTDMHSKVHNRRVCKDGPVFEAQEVIL